MRWFVRILILAVVVGALGAAGKWTQEYLRKRNIPEFATGKVETGSITSVVNSTGEVKPVLSVAVGSFVSGPIKELHVDFNDQVKEGQLLAEIDPRIYQAAVAGDQAVLAIRRGEVKRVEADLAQARADEQRADQLLSQGKGFVSQVEVDQARFSRQSLEAQLVVAEAGVAQAEASLANSEANLGYTRIESPVDGIIIDRKIEPGQTLAAQFQTPELFTVAPDIRDEVHIFASVDEADIGHIRKAQVSDQEVKFTVDAYPDVLFVGAIKQVRLSPVEVQNVVTYPVVVSAPNDDGKLMPGMTASLSFRIERRDDCLKIPNAALRFFPEVQFVREEDKKIVTGLDDSESTDEVDEESAEEKTAAASNKNRRHVWVWEDQKLRAIPVAIGIRDSRWTEVLSGDVKEGDALVTAKKQKK